MQRTKLHQPGGASAAGFSPFTAREQRNLLGYLSKHPVKKQTTASQRHRFQSIKATADSLNRKKFNESWVVFQPHTYSRLKNLLNDFAESLLTFDHIVLTDVYAAREKNVFNISSKDLADKLISLGKPVQYLSEFENIVEFLKRSAKPKDIVLTLGAGTVTNIGPMLLKNK